ncbi:MAG: phosphoenolpyruvate carboxykinase domain-containing protein, partial [Gammaproteobacteria bacterium]
FHVNWFRKDEDGRFIWPGFGDNLRVLEWIIGRCRGDAEALDTPVGRVPAEGAIRTGDLALADGAMDELTRIDAEGWAQELEEVDDYLRSYDDRTPGRLLAQLDRVRAELAGR